MKLLLIIIVIFLALATKKLVEPIVLHCCGNVKDFDHTSNNPPHRISRCLKSWTKPCTSHGSKNCCEGVDVCQQTREGGKCKKSDGSGYYIYDLNGVKMEYTEDDEKDDIAERMRVWRTDDTDEVEEDKLDFSNDYDYLTILNYFLIVIISIVIILLIIKYLISSKTEEKKEESYTFDKYLGSYGDYSDYGSYRQRSIDYDYY